MLVNHYWVMNQFMMMDMTAIKETVAANLKKLRESHGLTVNAFAKHCGMKQSVYDRLEKAEVTQHLESLHKIADKCSINVWQLLVPGFDPSNPPLIKQPSSVELEFYQRIKDAARELNIPQ